MTVLGADERTTDRGTISARTQEAERRNNRMPVAAFDFESVGPIEGLWLADDYEALGHADGASVPTWTDSLNGQVGTAGGTGSAPVLRTNVVAGNGHAAIEFSSADKFMELALPARVRTTCSMFVVGRMLSGPPGRLLSGNYAGLGENWLIGWHGGHENVCYTNGWVDGSGGAGVATTGNMRMYDLVASGSSKLFRGDGITMGSTPQTQAFSSILLSGYGSAGSETVNSQVFAVIVYEFALSLGDTQLVEAELAARYGIAI